MRSQSEPLPEQVRATAGSPTRANSTEAHSRATFAAAASLATLERPEVRR